MIELFLCGLRCGVFLLGALGLLAVLGLVIVLIIWKTIGFAEDKTVTVQLDQDEYEKLSRMLEEYDSRNDDGK